MAQPISAPIQLVEQVNRCPEVVQLQVDAVPTDGGLEVFIALQFGQMVQPLAGGKAQVAIARSYLTLELENAQWVQPAVAPSIVTDWGHLLPSPESTATQPSWMMSARDGGVLRDTVERTSLGRVQVGDRPVKLTATLTTTPADHCLMDVEGLWRHDISPNRHGLLERKLVRLIWQQRFAPYLGRVKLCYNCPEPCSVTAPTGDSEINLLEDGAIASLIQSVVESPSDALPDLANLLELEVRTELAGLSIRGGSLNGLDLSGTDLSWANLRGTDLTDTELSEANLTGARLAGADLSGADLGSANLQGADLRRASLALANLSGANLREANLSQTNLSQTNLNGALVAGAQFGDN
ncbi:MAG: pentapeptide repeat-containing protein, partial [Synechococcales bacterium]|nr:pentapeptide repeat-containing protein [Synechococcales bacterium]